MLLVVLELIMFGRRWDAFWARETNCLRSYKKYLLPYRLLDNAAMQRAIFMAQVYMPFLEGLYYRLFSKFALYTTLECSFSAVWNAIYKRVYISVDHDLRSTRLVHFSDRSKLNYLDQIFFSPDFWQMLGNISKKSANFRSNFGR